MKVIESTAALATMLAANELIERLLAPDTRNVMVAGGNTPLALYAAVADRCPRLAHLNIFALDEYVGVPSSDPDNCANLIRRCVVEPWGVPPDQYFSISSHESEAQHSIADHERRIHELGGLDLVILGLGRNGHIGFNEPGSLPDSVGRVVSLSPISVQANREWFRGKYAPPTGATTGMRTILSAKGVWLLAFGSHKAQAVAAMVEGPIDPACPASYLQSHAGAVVFLDYRAAAHLSRRESSDERI
jgi:glucosamine-6-phosphate deaminase